MAVAPFVYTARRSGSGPKICRTACPSAVSVVVIAAVTSDDELPHGLEMKMGILTLEVAAGLQAGIRCKSARLMCDFSKTVPMVSNARHDHTAWWFVVGAVVTTLSGRNTRLTLQSM